MAALAVRVVARATGVAESTGSRGVGELDRGPVPSGRVPAPKRLADIGLRLVPALLLLTLSGCVRVVTVGDLCGMPVSCGTRMAGA